MAARLEAQLGQWEGRTVALLGTLEPCPWSEPAAQTRNHAGYTLVLAAARGSAMLSVVPASAPPWLVRLPSALPLFTPLRVTVRLELLPPISCGQVTCYAARLA
jgi:hypothetical protein